MTIDCFFSSVWINRSIQNSKRASYPEDLVKNTSTTKWGISHCSHLHDKLQRTINQKETEIYDFRLWYEYLKYLYLRISRFRRHISIFGTMLTLTITKSYIIRDFITRHFSNILCWYIAKLMNSVYVLCMSKSRINQVWHFYDVRSLSLYTHGRVYISNLSGMAKTNKVTKA